jgi:lipopolysaccharide assembly outer membrane protein LptD (OstA)
MLIFTSPLNHIFNVTCIFAAMMLISLSVNGQELPADSTFITPEFPVNDYISTADSMSLPIGDTSKTILDSKIDYSSEDSIVISVSKQRIYLYGKSNVDYQDVNLKSDYIEFDLNDNTVVATGLPDSTGSVAGRPVFTKGSETFDSDTLRYNFESQKGVIKKIITKQGEGFLHSEKTKRLESGEIHIATGKYTTCDVKIGFLHTFKKGDCRPDEKIISGPAYLVLEDIPLPLALPFGFFPYTSTRASGLIIPTYGEERTRGFFLRNGGWYMAINDYMDITLLGTIYSRGTWGLTASSVYSVRYKFSAAATPQNFIFFFNNNVNDDPGFKQSKDLRICWSISRMPSQILTDAIGNVILLQWHMKESSYNIMLHNKH